MRGERLDPDVFDLPVEKMREGYYTDAYFNHTRATLLADGRHPRVVMQVFQRHTAMLGGMDEAIAVLKLCSDDWDGLEVFALYDGDTIEPWETVMTIEGDYTLFGHLETVYLGVLARRTLIATNTERVLRAANGKPIIFMAARHDHHRVQTGDGYAAYVAGAIRGSEIGVTSDAQASWWGGRGVGTVPHALIAAYGGDTVLAAQKFAEWAPDDLRITVLVDFENDSVTTALAVADALGPKLWGVRLDTSGQLVDRSLWEEMGDFDPRGVNERLVRKVRAALDGAGHEQVRIVASGGFSVAKIEEFERRGVPVDAYGVGSSLIRGENDFTADLIVTDGRPSAKVGRRAAPERAARACPLARAAGADGDAAARPAGARACRGGGVREVVQAGGRCPAPRPRGPPRDRAGGARSEPAQAWARPGSSRASSPRCRSSPRSSTPISQRGLRSSSPTIRTSSCSPGRGARRCRRRRRSTCCSSMRTTRRTTSRRSWAFSRRAGRPCSTTSGTIPRCRMHDAMRGCTTRC